ncbi:MAG: hypothetical protein AVDCRST_MAG43-677 [uncultured Thermomicrobiales bacterium]|uniref:Uncharacterized protein n=1 Tax=uncultured Thermomicrobiales bacterium TaxID=1645740 RepID=A0A6J4UF36_9BACT|nr:MAG: hypothetical protein AVDCRST_MAG43-677 [uncultured Thermomicrobiales bacterium]
MGGLTRIRTLGLGALLLGGVAASGMGVGLAQQESEVPVHPANVLAGPCDDLDPVATAQLSPVSVLVNTGDDAENTPQGVLTAGRVLLSSTEGVELSLEDILASAHSINISLSDQEIDTGIACGEIGGVPVEGDLYIGLRDVNGSGFSGVARLSEDGDNTNVDIFLTEPTDESAPATPVA